jgi:hypothetical protein
MRMRKNDLYKHLDCLSTNAHFQHSKFFFISYVANRHLICITGAIIRLLFHH